MLFSVSPKMQWLSKQSLLIAFFFVFSFNHIVLTKYHFVLGQASFYFIAIALLTGYFPIFKAIPKRSLIFFTIFLIYCLGSASFFCWTGQGVCSTRPYTAAISLVFVFLFVQYTAYVTQNNPGFALSAEKYLVAGAWALVLLSVPDIIVIARGGMLNHLPYGLDFLSPLGLSPYDSSRLRGFAQEPSYLGMAISTLYPICFMRLNQKFNLERLLLVILLWVCLAFSLSRTGLLTCFILTGVILLFWPRRLVVALLVAASFALAWKYWAVFSNNIFLSLSWVPYLNQPSVDGSSLIRFAHITASINAWLEHPLYGLGLGQSGFLLPNFYPGWYNSDSPEYYLWAPKAVFGGTPSFSFMPKLLAEIGILGLVLLVSWAFQFFRNIEKPIKIKELIGFYTLSFAGFLLSSFGIDGYLYLPAWLIFGLIVGLARPQIKATISLKTRISA